MHPHRPLPDAPPVISSLPSYNILQLVLICVRMVPIAALMSLVLIFQEYIRPRVPSP